LNRAGIDESLEVVQDAEGTITYEAFCPTERRHDGREVFKAYPIRRSFGGAVEYYLSIGHGRPGDWVSLDASLHHMIFWMSRKVRLAKGD
jgi:hypothetical protein